MKTLLVTLLAAGFLAAPSLIATPAMAASDYDAKTVCTPMTGNWVNAATENCQSTSGGHYSALQSGDRVRPEPPARECDPKGETASRRG